MASPNLTEVLDDVKQLVKQEMSGNPVVLPAGDDFSIEDLFIEARKWHRFEEVVAVVADLKGSTNLGLGRHAASTAAIYEAATGGLVKILAEFGADFVAIQGDGAVGIYWGERRMERGLCAAITVKTFNSRVLMPRLTKKFPTLPSTGFKIGVACSPVLVKRVGVARTDHNEPVWAGKAVNYAAKCAQQADSGEMFVTGTIWDFVEGNDYLSTSCGCGSTSGVPSELWTTVEIEKIHVDDGERSGRSLSSVWCLTHGESFCEAVMSGKSKRPESETIRTAMLKTLSADPKFNQERLKRLVAHNG